MGAKQGIEGYRVVAVQTDSPLAKAGLQVYLDFILSANGLPLKPNGTFSLLTQHHTGQRLSLQVYNLISQSFREVTVIPDENWGGEGLLGGLIRYEVWDPRVIGVKVVRVVAGSQAEEAGLQEEDIILGTEATAVSSIDQLCAVLGESRKLYIYTPSSREVRWVQVTEAALGIEAEAANVS